MEQEKKKSKLMIIIPIVAVIIIAVVGIVIVLNSSMSKEKMLEVAEVLNYYEIKSAMGQNQNRAIEEYKDKIFKCTGSISEISNNYVKISVNKVSSDIIEGYIKVYLNKNEIKALNMGDTITVVGKLDKIDYETKESMFGGTSAQTKTLICELANAYFVSDRINIMGVVKIPFGVDVVKDSRGKTQVVNKSDTEWYCSITDTLNPDKKEYYLTECVPVEKRKFGEIPTIDGKEFKSLYVMKIDGAKVVNKKIIEYEKVDVMTPEEFKEMSNAFNQ